MLKLKGSIKISGDKSISHRALIFASLSTGKVKISNLLESDDVMRTLNILRELGIKIVKKKTEWIGGAPAVDGGRPRQPKQSPSKNKRGDPV